VSAAATARAEAELWIGIVAGIAAVRLAHPDPGPREVDVTGFDPTNDLNRRAARWGHRLASSDLAELGRYAAALAVTEAEAWERDDAIVATRAFEDRRFLFSDRIVHWGVPWADVVGRCHPPVREPAHEVRDRLLDLGDRLRPAPLMTGDEGLHLPGEDSLGPLPGAISTVEILASLHCGTVIFEATAASLTGGPHPRRFDQEELDDVRLRRDLVSLFQVAAARWAVMAESHPGTARLWRDLARRADRTAELLDPV
jgi:hypothetical protein